MGFTRYVLELDEEFTQGLWAECSNCTIKLSYRFVKKKDIGSGYELSPWKGSLVPDEMCIKSDKKLRRVKLQSRGELELFMIIPKINV